MRSRRAISLATLFAAAVGFYSATYSFRGITDTAVNSLQTRAFVTHGDIDLSRYPESAAFLRPDLEARQVVEQDGELYSVYGVGVSVAAAPAYAALVRLDASEAMLQGSVGVLYAAGSVLLIYVALGAVAPPAVAAGATAVYAFGTTLWPVASMAFFPQGPVMFFGCLGLVGLLSVGRWAPQVAGLGFGMATFIRPTAAIPLVFVGLYHLAAGRRQVIRYALGALLPLGGVLFQNRIIWGEWLSGGYAQHGVGFRSNLTETLYPLLFGAWRGIFVYSPALLLGIVGILFAFRRWRAPLERRLLAVGMSSIATILVTAKWTAWHGGVNQFGYRLLLEVVPFLVVLGAYAVSRSDHLRPPALFLGVLSILTTTWGAAPSRNGWDGKLFATDFLDTSIGQAWVNFLDHPLPGLARLAGVAVITAAMVVIARTTPGRPAVDLENA